LSGDRLGAGRPRATGFVRHGVGVCLEAVRLLEHEGLEVLEEHPPLLEEVLHRPLVAEREMPFEEHPIKARERPGGRGRVRGDELPHGSPLPWPEVRRRIMPSGVLDCHTARADPARAGGELSTS
jgi:hypothetical protein